MGRTTILENKTCNARAVFLLERSKSIPFECGVLISQSTESKDTIVGIIPTPYESDDNGNAKKPSNLNAINDSYIVEHAKQISSMLCGGLEVVGLFLFCPSDSLKKNEGRVLQLLLDLHNRTRVFSHLEQSNEKMLFHVCSTSKKMTVKSFDFTNPRSASTRVCDQKFRPLLSSVPLNSLPDYKEDDSNSMVHSITVNLPIDFEVDFDAESSSRSIISIVEAKVEEFVKQLQKSSIAIDGKFLVKKDEESYLADLVKGNAHVLDFFIPLGEEEEKEGNIETEGRLRITGSVQSKTFVLRETVSSSLKLVQRDIAKSILARLHLAMDVHSQVLGGNATKLKGKNGSISLPRRVYSSLVVAGDENSSLVLPSFQTCDYVMDDETLEDSHSRFVEMFAIVGNKENIKLTSEEETGKTKKVEKPKEKKQTKSVVTEESAPAQLQQTVQKTESNLTIPLAALAIVALLLAIYLSMK